MEASMTDSIFSLSAKTNEGRELPFSAFEGKILLVVNTASKCGFTPQYKGLEDLYQKYKDRGLVVLGFPCDQFAHQEPGSDDEIAAFCQRNFGVSFPLMAKVEVNGAGTHPVFEFLKARAPGAIGKTVKWNFTKFLVHRDGKSVTRYAPATEPMQLEKDIEAAFAS
jgi:glutathione peroxidase